jgi:hypothetical protein
MSSRAASMSSMPSRNRRSPLAAMVLLTVQPKLEEGCPSVERCLQLVHVLGDCVLFLEAVFDDLGLHVAIKALHDSLLFVGSASGPSTEQGSFGKDEARETAQVAVVV